MNVPKSIERLYLTREITPVLHPSPLRVEILSVQNIGENMWDFRVRASMTDPLVLVPIEAAPADPVHAAMHQTSPTMYKMITVLAGYRSKGFATQEAAAEAVVARAAVDLESNQEGASTEQITRL